MLINSSQRKSVWWHGLVGAAPNRCEMCHLCTTSSPPLPLSLRAVRGCNIAAVDCCALPPHSPRARITLTDRCRALEKTNHDAAVVLMLFIVLLFSFFFSYRFYCTVRTRKPTVQSKKATPHSGEEGSSKPNPTLHIAGRKTSPTATVGSDGLRCR